jgi:hypothetical protein
MKILFFALSALIVSSFTLTHEGDKPGGDKYKTFDSTLVVHLYHGGGMHYSSQDVYIRYDSCIRVDMLQGKDMRTGFAMNDELRKKVMDIVNETNAIKIKQDNSKGFAHDKATTSVCFEFRGQKDFCAQTGASTEIAEGSKVDFGNLWDKLQEFSLSKGSVAKPAPAPVLKKKAKKVRKAK